MAVSAGHLRLDWVGKRTILCAAMVFQILFHRIWSSSNIFFIASMTNNSTNQDLAGIDGPYAYSRHDIAAALCRLGYTRYGDPALVEGRPLSPELLVACLFYSRDHSWISSIAVVLCRADIDWALMVQMAKDYGFAGALRGIIEGVRAEGREVGAQALEMLTDYEPIKPERVREVLDIYGC